MTVTEVVLGQAKDLDPWVFPRTCLLGEHAQNASKGGDQRILDLLDLDDQWVDSSTYDWGRTEPPTEETHSSRLNLVSMKSCGITRSWSDWAVLFSLLLHLCQTIQWPHHCLDLILHLSLRWSSDTLLPHLRKRLPNKDKLHFSSQETCKSDSHVNWMRIRTSCEEANVTTSSLGRFWFSWHCLIALSMDGLRCLGVAWLNVTQTSSYKAVFSSPWPRRSIHKQYK